MRKTVALVLLLAFTQSAFGFPVDLNVEQRTATDGKPAVFSVEGSNDFAENRSFRISSIQSVPKASNWFSYDSSVETLPGENFSIEIRVDPPENAIQGNYGFTANIRTLEGDNLQKLDSYFTVDSATDISITSYSTETAPLNPGESVSANLTVLNTAAEPVRNLGFEASILGQTTSRNGFELPPGASLSQQLEIRLPVNSSPGEKQLLLSITRDGQPIENITQSVEVAEVTDVRKTSSLEDRIFANTKTLKAENMGNSAKKVSLNASVPTYLEPLTGFSAEPDETHTSDGSSIYYWSFDLEEGETETVSYTTRYWPPLLVIGFILAGLVGIRKIQSSVSIRKETVQKQDGLKVRLSLKNSSGSDIERLELKDFVPDIASVRREFEIAKPVIRTTNDGTRLTWEVEDLGPGEERVLEYMIEPLYEVEGGVNLPSAEIYIEDQKVAESGEVKTEFSP